MILWLEEPKIEQDAGENLADGAEPGAKNFSKDKTAEAEEPFSPYHKAPEIIGTQAWINSQPLTIAGLKGKLFK